ncbi:MAG: 1,4-alpha-glucan branching enzyme, partial [Bacilli bacterium]|nr:1,4-alpha-glucan branching enzyme [Bacilli bacterium]
MKGTFMHIEWFDDYLNGRSVDAYEHLGAHFTKNEKGEEGIEFLVYAPLAKAINVLGDFNSWSVYDSSMKKIDERGLFYLFVKDAKMYQSYKYHILG